MSDSLRHTEMALRCNCHNNTSTRYMSVLSRAVEQPTCTPTRPLTPLHPLTQANTPDDRFIAVCDANSSLPPLHRRAGAVGTMTKGLTSSKSVRTSSVRRARLVRAAPSPRDQLTVEVARRACILARSPTKSRIFCPRLVVGTTATLLRSEP